MPKMLYKTKGNADPKKKPRVYFTCHPDDFLRYFEKIVEDIFKTHDCAIYYTEDMTAAFEADHLETDLGQMNLFVVPVTWRLLSQPNRAMDVDLAYAKQVHIPILPFMMEQGIDEIYSQPEKFGQRQYLNPYSTDLSEIRYEDKLKKHLESVLISDELAKRVRAAFDAYIFLSYRKKDRKYANELMKLIHKNPECRDIAIWYDEFLIPGESFAENIKKALEDSKLFALLVTPSLLEEPEGKPNYVMAEEYPAAVHAKKPILPAQMEPTDPDVLAEKFPSIPTCADPQDEESFKERLLQSLHRIAITANDDDPEHNFLIGLAYLDGIDVEVNRDRGIELLTMAAEADLLEAMERLYEIYSNGIGVPIDYRKALYWAQRIVDHYEKHQGRAAPNTLSALHQLGLAYYHSGQFQEALDTTQQAYRNSAAILGPENPHTLRSMINMAIMYDECGLREYAYMLMERSYELSCQIHGQKHSDSLTVLHNLASFCLDIGMEENALEMAWEAYTLRCEAFGREHLDTMASLTVLAAAYIRLRQYQQGLELSQEAYKLYCKNAGEHHPNTITVLGYLASAYHGMGDLPKALELQKQIYDVRCSIYGKEHPRTCNALSNVAAVCFALGNRGEAVQYMEDVYQTRCKILGSDHPDTFESFKRLIMLQRQS